MEQRLVPETFTSGKKTFTEVTTVAATAGLLLAANGSRTSCEIQNLGTTTLWIANSNTVSASHGFKLAAGTSYYDPHSRDAWWGYQETSPGDVRVLEVTQ